MAKILSGVKLPERRTDAPSPQKQFDTSLGAPVESKPVSDAPAQATVPAKREGIAAVHTLKHDLQDVVAENKISLVRAAALEQEKRRPEPLEAPTASARKPIGKMVVLILMFALLGAGALFGVYYIAQPSGEPLPQTFESLIFAETAEPLTLSGQTADALKFELSRRRLAGSAKLGAIARIVPLVGANVTGSEAGSARPATFAEFLDALEAAPPEGLLRALASDFFLGLHTVDKNATVIIVPVISYDHAFSAMLQWERTINRDLASLFTEISPLRVDETGAVTERTFVDEVNRNFDVRALKNESGETLLYYSFPSRNLLIIAESPYSYAEILSRLQAARQL